MTEPAFSTPWITVDYVPAQHGDGTSYEHTRITGGNGRGAVVIPFTWWRGRVKVGLVSTMRPALGAEMIEFCRGMVEDDSAAEALREFGEEFGLGEQVQEFSHRKIGEVAVDSGIMANTSGIWVVYVRPEIAEATEGFREDETGGVVQWQMLDTLRVMIAQGKVKDNFTLSGLALAESTSAFHVLF